MNLSAAAHPHALRALLSAPICMLAGCGPEAVTTDASGPQATSAPATTPIPLNHARYLRLERGDGFVVARLRAPVADQGGASEQAQSATILLVPRGSAPPPLAGDLEGAILVRTPAMRIAANAGSDEAFLGQLGVKERLVAVGGLVSYDDDIRAKAKAGELGQVGYNWHSPPNLDVLLALRPDVFLMRLSDLAHAPVLQRARSLGLSVLPTFAEDEPTYLGRAEWIKLHGLLTGTGDEADRLFATVESRVAQLKNLAASRPRVDVLWAYPNGADRWIATVRGAEAGYIRDAGGDNLLARPEDPQRDSAETLSSEAILPFAARTQVWLIGDIHAVPPRSDAVLRSFPAWREGRLFGNTGRTAVADNAYDWYQTAIVRPDWVLEDFVKALHPQLVPGPFRFLKPLRQGEYQ